jgi:hypothetical protein
MSLSINPLSKLIASASSSISATVSEAQGALSGGIASLVSKSGLDATVGRLSGELNSGLNGITSGISSAAGSLQSAAGQLGQVGSALGGQVGSAMGGIGSQVQSAVGGAVGTLTSVTGSISNISADISGSLNKLAGGNLAGGLMSFAGAVSKSAGMLNNILSLRRGINLPAGGQMFEQSGAAIKLEPGAKNDWRVRIQAQWNLFNSPIFKVLEETGGVVWPFLPNITVSTKANYTQLDPVHNIYPFQAYKNSQVDEIQISGEFSCETETDAAYWIAATLFFKTATKMFYGQSPNAGNPPVVCNLTGYGSSVFNNVPVVIKSFSVDLKDDVNYIRCNSFGTNTWVPVISTISVTVMPVYSRQKLRQFDLQKYASGQMTDASGFGYM